MQKGQAPAKKAKKSGKGVMCPGPTVTFQDWNAVVYAQSDTRMGQTLYTALIAFDAAGDGIMNSPDGRPLYTDTLSIKAVSDDLLSVSYSVFTYGGVPFDLGEQMDVNNGTVFTPEILVFDVGNVYGAPAPFGTGPDVDGIDIGAPFELVDGTSRVFWHFANGDTLVGDVPHLGGAHTQSGNPNDFHLQYFMPIDESDVSRHDAIGFTITEELRLLPPMY